MRSLSAPAIASANAQETDEVWLVLLIIDHPNIAPPIRVCNNNEDIVSNGETFIAFPFDIELPGEDQDQPGVARVRIDNVDRKIVDTLRAITSPPTVTIQAILASSPDTLEAEFSGLTLRNAEYDATTVTGELHFENILAEPLSTAMTPSVLPGLF